ncbi:hypothetical protein ACIRPX_00250 [Streptomyces sp. NPDC101225]|uniref:hypothetical protein n=1 Tax=Streptomyces sp. NPDC101225 TaxID=3366135 RepID=UPI00380A7C65
MDPSGRERQASAPADGTRRAGGGVPGGRRGQQVSPADAAGLAGVSSQTVPRVSDSRPRAMTSPREHGLPAMRDLDRRPDSAAHGPHLPADIGAVGLGGIPAAGLLVPHRLVVRHRTAAPRGSRR